MPATYPLSVSQVNKIKSRRQAVRWSATLREIRQFRAYCCDINSDGIMGVAKEPVPIVSIGPSPICLGDDISWNISNSYAPGSTLTAWEVDFGDSSSASGADFPVDTTYGTHEYASAGSYTVTVTITEGLGKTQTAEVEIVVIDCSTEPLSYTYISTDGSGIFYIDWTADSPEWTSCNEGLPSAALYVRSLVQAPNTKHLPRTSHVLWAATQNGIYKSEDGGTTWAKMNMGDPSNVEFGDSPAATEDELDWHHIVFDPTDDSIIYVLATKGS